MPFCFGNKMGRVTLGKYPDLDLKSARQKTDEFRRMVSMGLDHVRSEKRGKDCQAKYDSRTHGKADFVDQYASPKNSSWKQAENNLEALSFVTALGKQSIHDVKRPDIHAILDDLVEREKLTAANESLSSHTQVLWVKLVRRVAT